MGLARISPTDSTDKHGYSFLTTNIANLTNGRLLGDKRLPQIAWTTQIAFFLFEHG